ncbi:short chain dehydrogenase [Ceratobasidium sp. AG-Ba]|nr:short chain dehydrogenase [Ceratobasidium sp. AG-Ba]
MGSYLSTTPKAYSELPGKVVVVTGANRGIGFTVAKRLYELNATVYLGCRKEEDAIKAIQEIRAQVPNSSGRIKWLWVDLSTIQKSRESAEGFIKVEKSLDILVNNAAISDKKFATNEDGIEIMMAVNYFGMFVLTMTLLDLMKQTSTKPGSDVRIVNVSSDAQEMWGNPTVTFTDPAEFSTPFPAGKYDSWVNRVARYGRSKLGVILFTSELQQRLKVEGSDIIAISLNPGIFTTGTSSDAVAGIPIFGPVAIVIFKLLYPPGSEGAGNIMFAAVDPTVRAEAEKYKGKFLAPTGLVTAPSKYARDVELSKRLWGLTEMLVQSKTST